MNRVHKDGRALLALSGKMNLGVRNKSRPVSRVESTSVPSDGIQRQDTDYDVKPEIPTPNPSSGKSVAKKSKQQKQSSVADEGAPSHATQMGESECGSNRDAERTQLRILRSIHI